MQQRENDGQVLVVPEIDFGPQAVTQKFAFLGRSGSGKSFGARRLVEQLLHLGAQVLVVDSVGVWFGLREGRDLHKGFAVPIIGGLYGDIPLEPSAGELVAEVAVSTGSSMVLDVSGMTDGERARFMEALGRRIFALKKESRSPLHIVLDEAQDVVPQNTEPNEKVMLSRWVRIAKQGRAFGLGLSLCSQRPQEISKKALNQVECVLAFQLTGPHERKALDYWLSDKGMETKLSDQLPLLEIGTPFVWSPQWLKVAGVVGRVLPIETADTSQTPEMGVALRPPALRTVDLSALRQSMEAIVEQAEAADPELLRQRIRHLERQLEERPVFNVMPLLEQATKVEAALRVVEIEAARLVAAFALPPPAPAPKESPPLAPAPRKRERSAAASPRPHAAPRPVAEEAVLANIYQYGELGIPLSAVVVATRYGTSTVRNAVTRLVRQKLVERRDGMLVATAAAKARVSPSAKPLPRGKKLVAHLIETLPEAEARLLSTVAKANTEVSVAQLIAETGYGTSTVRNAVGHLVRRLVLRRPRPAVVALHRENLGL